MQLILPTRVTQGKRKLVKDTKSDGQILKVPRYLKFFQIKCDKKFLDSNMV